MGRCCCREDPADGSTAVLGCGGTRDFPVERAPGGRPPLQGSVFLNPLWGRSPRVGRDVGGDDIAASGNWTTA